MAGDARPRPAAAANIAERGVDGHCDCAFWINHGRWCWPDIGGLVAPWALLMASGSRDALWRPAGYRDTADGLTLRVRSRAPRTAPAGTMIVAAAPAAEANFHRLAPWPADMATAVATVEVRHTAETSLGPGALWSVRRTCPLMGHSLEERQVADLPAGIAAVARRPAGPLKSAVFGSGDRFRVVADVRDWRPANR